ncbi:MAG: hypothetical protein APF76_17070 [Desulfitibacter sp. BRH_c19]|nr:MAG: hypothetical protein APF76_17070 [Desulfitibacter sp. BRH_c19]
MSQPLVKVQNLKKYFPIGGGLFNHKKHTLKAVDDVSFSVEEGETFGIVGESGCGKSTLGRIVLRLLEPTDGHIYFENEDITQLSKDELRQLRRNMQMIFQDPYGSLNSRMTVSYIIREPLIVHEIGDRKEQEQKVQKLLEVVGLNSTYAKKLPHELSSGQRQRIGIARALAINPKLIICDEPVSALDASIQSQVLNLLQELQKEFNLTYIFISHDLGVVRYISDKVAVMYLGKLVELSDKDNIYQNPLHPYTKALLSAIPVPKINGKKERIILKWDVPNLVNPPSGCRFSTRCQLVQEKCKQIEPKFSMVGDKHFVACHLVNN